MIKKENIILILEKYPGGDDFFLVDVHVSRSNKIFVFVDRREGISIDECAKLSKFIEHHLDKEKEDFELMVSSPGLESPFMVMEQYKKNIGGKIKIQLMSGETHQGELVYVEKEEITLREQGKTKKKQKRGNIPVKTIQYPMGEIKTAKLSIEPKNPK